jgi:hypothetical protein
MMIVGKETHS